MNDKIRLNFFVPEKLHVATKALAKRRGTNVSQVIRDALLEYVRTELQKEKSGAES